jgi:excisionase family DNA binding protein
MLTAVEAAEILGLSDSRVRQRIKSGDIVATKVGGKWRIPRASLDAPEPDRSTPERSEAERSETVATEASDRNGPERTEAEASGVEIVHVPVVPYERLLLEQVQDLRTERDRLLGLIETQTASLSRQEDRILALTGSTSKRWWQFWKPMPRIRVAH